MKYFFYTTFRLNGFSLYSHDRYTVTVEHVQLEFIHYKLWIGDDCLFILHLHAHDIIIHEIAVSYMMIPCAYFL